METEHTENFLKESLMPSMKMLLELNMSLAKTQASGYERLSRSVNGDMKHTELVEKAVKTLNQSVNGLTNPMTQLIESVNKSNRLQEEQNRLLAEMNEILSENTARLNVLNLALAKQTEDAGMKGLYEVLSQRRMDKGCENFE